MKLTGGDIVMLAITVAMATLIGRIVEPVIERALDRVLPKTPGVMLP